MGRAQRQLNITLLRKLEQKKNPFLKDPLVSEFSQLLLFRKKLAKSLPTREMSYKLWVRDLR